MHKLSARDIKEITRLYTDEGLSVRELATRFGCSYGRIYGMLRGRVAMRGTSRGRRRNLEYVRVAEIMRERIVVGHWQPGHKIWPQHELMAAFDVSHQAVRDAITHLRQRGYLWTLPNEGTYVRPPRDWRPDPGGGAGQS